MAIEIDLQEVTRTIYHGNEDAFLARYDQVVDETVIPILFEAGLEPMDREDSSNTEAWTDKAQTVLTWLCMMDKRIERTLFAAINDHIKALADQHNAPTGADDEMVLVCACGEVFDAITTASGHFHSNEELESNEFDFKILPRSEAF